jgi:hypothetical protein
MKDKIVPMFEEELKDMPASCGCKDGERTFR